MMAKEVVFIADDFGMAPEINDAICHAHALGNLTGTALMMGQHATDDAVACTRAQPGLQVGWHLHLTDSQPVTTTRWPWGKSPAAAGFAIGLFPGARALARREITRQWELFQATGMECRFINSHHHLHAHPFVYRTLLDIVGPKFTGWIRLGRPQNFQPNIASNLTQGLVDTFQARRRRLSPWRATDTLWGLDRQFRMNAGETQEAIASLSSGFHEFLFHPRTRTCPDTQCLLDLRSFSS